MPHGEPASFGRFPRLSKHAPYDVWRRIQRIPARSALRWRRLFPKGDPPWMSPCRCQQQARTPVPERDKFWKGFCSPETAHAGSAFQDGSCCTQCAGGDCWCSCVPRNGADARKNPKPGQSVPQWP